METKAQMRCCFVYALIVLLGAIVPKLAFAQALPPQIIIPFGTSGLPIPLDWVPLLAAMGIILIVLIAYRMGKLRGAATLTAVAAAFALAGAGFFGIDTVRAQIAKGKSENVLVQNKTGQPVTLQSVAMNDSAFCTERSVTREVTHHIITADGLVYGYVASGDYILARMHDAEERPVYGFEVQSRFLPGYGVSCPQAAAIQVGNDVVEVRAAPFDPSGSPFGVNSLELHVNGQLLAPLNNNSFWAELRSTRVLNLPSGGLIYFDDFAGRYGGRYWVPRAITMLWPQHSAFSEYTVKLSTPYNEEGSSADSLLEIQLIRPDEARYSARGMLGNNDGNPNNDFIRRNGQVLAQDSAVNWTALYALFGGDWLVKPQECLFSGGCITEPQFPTKAVVLTDEQRTLGEIACANLAGYYREACIHDVGLSGSIELVKNYYANTEDLNSMAERIVTPGVDVPVYFLSVGEKTDLPGYGGERFRRAYQVTHKSGEGQFLLTIRPPRGASAFFSEGTAGPLTPSFAATGNKDVSIDVQCDKPDPNWALLGNAWAVTGAVQLWAVDPLSGFVKQLLDEKPLVCL